MKIGRGLVNIFGVALLLASGVTFAGSAKAVRRQVEASMLVAGTIVVDTQGNLHALTITDETTLPPGVSRLVRKHAQQWRFEPVLIDGKAVVAKTGMSLRVIAKPMPEGAFQLRIGGASFGEGSPNPNAIIRSSNLTPPTFPREAASIGATGTAYVVAKVGRDGKVNDASVEQVNLNVVARERDMETIRRIFASNAKAAAFKWSFHPPTEGDQASEEFWTVRVPVVYSLWDGKEKKTASGWQAYVPGPRQPIPWKLASEGPAFSPDAAPDGSVRLAGSGLKLLLAPEG